MSQKIQIVESAFSRLLFSDTRASWFWLLVRVYVGWVWLEAGWEKFNNPAWHGAAAGAALKGFISAALKKTAGAHPDVSGWYATFLQNTVSNHAAFFSQLITYGEILVGIALILGLLTGIAAFFGIFMNFNFLFAGTVSINPLLVLLTLFIILAWRNAGWYGLDRYALPALGTPWQPGAMFRN